MSRLFQNPYAHSGSTGGTLLVSRRNARSCAAGVGCVNRWTFSGPAAARVERITSSPSSQRTPWPSFSIQAAQPRLDSTNGTGA